MGVYEELSQKNIKALCEFINGDSENSILKYRTGTEIIDNYEHKLNLTGLVSGASRWILTANVIEYFSKEGRLDYYFNVMFSIRNIRKDHPMESEETCATLQEDAFRIINSILLQDDYEFVKQKGRYFLRKVYSNLEPIGKGGFAEVFKNLDSDIVVKKLKDEYKADRGVISRFKKEFEITKNTLSDIKGIIKVYDYNADEISYTMEYVEQDLKNYVENHALTESQKLKLIMDILSIMKSVHERGVIHRDLSPKNIFVRDGNPIIADFGLGKDLNVLRSHQTYDTSYQGTLDYCDPRQLRNLSDGDKQSDIYSLGRIINFIMNKEPNNTNHSYLIPATIATSEDANVRYKTIEDLISAIDTLIEQNKNADYVKKCEMYLRSGKYMPFFDNYFLSFTGVDLVYKCDDQNFRNVYFAFMTKPENEQLIINVLSNTNDALKATRLAFKYLDGFGIMMVRALAYSNLSPTIKMKAAEIVEYIGYYINRYTVQNSLESYYKAGEINPVYIPNLLEILNKK